MKNSLKYTLKVLYWSNGKANEFNTKYLTATELVKCISEYKNEYLTDLRVQKFKFKTTAINF